MRVREEDCNIVLLAVVTVFTVAIAAGATLVGPPDKTPVQLAERTARSAPPAARDVIYVTDQPQVRVVGAPFVPNTNPRER